MSAPPTLFDALDEIGGGRDVLENVIAGAMFGVYVDHPERGCVYANGELLRQFGVEWADFEGFGWARHVHPEDAGWLSDAIREYEHGDDAIHVTYRVTRPDGTEGWVHARVHKVFDRRGRHVGSVGVTEDVTAQQGFRVHALRTQRLEAVGRLAARVCHDFNNVLSTILASASMLRYSVGDELQPDDLESLDQIEAGVDQASAVTRQLLSLTARGMRTRSSCDVDEELKKLRPLLDRAAGESVAIELSADAGGAHVPLDARSLGQIVLNLAINARDALSGQGVIRITAERRGEHALIGVADEGAGMPPETLARAFEPFFTTKADGRGTGLGLYSVREIIESAGGSISLVSERGVGTEARIELPVVAPVVRTSRAPRLAEGATGGGDCEVLVVDDNTALRQSVSYGLALSGYQVRAVGSIAAAHEARLETPPDLIIVDVLLPDGVGTDLVRAARQQRPELPVIFITGFAGEAAEYIEPDDRTALIEKPFHPADLVAAAQRVLEAGARQRSDVDDEALPAS